MIKSAKTNKAKVLIMAQVEPSSNPRPRRLMELFRHNGFEVHLASYKPAKPIDIDAHYEIKQPSLKFYMRAMRKLLGACSLLLPFEYWKNTLNNLRWSFNGLAKKISSQDFTLIVVEDIYLLPFAFQNKNKAKIHFDAREFYPEELGNSPLWGFTERPMRIRILKKYLHRCDLVTTVSEGLVERYETDFAVRPLLLRSMPYFCDLQPTPMPDDKIRMVHHGVANSDRKLENMIDIMALLDERFELDIYLTGTPGYIEFLKDRAKENPRIRIKPPIAFQDLIPSLNSYDLGFCYLEPTTFNLEQCLPNKFFEYIQARLALLIGPSAAMVPLVNQHRIGFITPSFDTEVSAKFINCLSKDDIKAAKEASKNAASILSYEHESGKILQKIQQILAA